MTSHPAFTDIDNYLDANLRTTSEQAEAAWDDLQKGFDWKRWLLIGEAVSTAHDLAEQSVGARAGRDFNDFMRAYYRLYPKLDQIDKSTRSLAVKCWRERDAIEQWRQSIGQAKALRFNHPTSTWRAFEASRRAPKGSNDRKKAEEEATRAKGPQTDQALKAEIARLRKRVEELSAMGEAMATENAKLKREGGTHKQRRTGGPTFTRAQLAIILSALHPDHAKQDDIEERRKRALQIVTERMAQVKK